LNPRGTVKSPLNSYREANGPLLRTVMRSGCADGARAMVTALDLVRVLAASFQHPGSHEGGSE
jgi:hypothetical protein